MNKSKKSTTLLLLGIAIAISIAFYIYSEGSRFRFERFEIPKSASVDTIEIIKERNIEILGVSVPRLLDNFNYYIVIKKTTGDKKTIYRVDSRRSGARVSKDYFAIVPFGESNWGWFYIQDGKIESKLPNIDKFRDSLKRGFSDSSFIRDSNGYIDIFIAGRLIKSINYGNLSTKFKILNFDSLDYKLYRLQDDSLSIVSENADVLLSQKNGIYFIPSPGYRVIKKCPKESFFKILDSVSLLKEPPKQISLDL